MATHELQDAAGYRIKFRIFGNAAFGGPRAEVEQYDAKGNSFGYPCTGTVESARETWKTFAKLGFKKVGE